MDALATRSLKTEHLSLFSPVNYVNGQVVVSVNCAMSKWQFDPYTVLLSPNGQMIESEVLVLLMASDKGFSERAVAKMTGDLMVF